MAKILSVRPAPEPVETPVATDGAEPKAWVSGPVLTTQEEWGPRLLIGVPMKNGLRDRSVAFKPWDLKSEIAASDFRSLKKNANTADVVSRVLSTFLTQWGPHDFTDKKLEEKVAILEGSWSADVLYAWILLRMAALGPVVVVPVECPSDGCGRKMDVDLDLTGLELAAAHDEDTLKVKKALPTGFCLSKESPWSRMPGLTGLITELTLQPMKWSAFTLIRKDQILKTGETKAAFMVASICGAAGVDGISLSIKDVETMGKLDFEAASSSGIEFRPVLDFSIDCPSCSTHIRDVPLPWDYGSFFSKRASSR